MRTHTSSVASLLAILVCLAACGGGGGGGGGGTPVGPAPVTPPTVTVTGLRVSGTLSEPAAVTIKGVADDDGVADSGFRVAFTLDGSGGSRGLAMDPGPSAVGTDVALPIVATDGAGNAARRNLVVTFNP